MNTVNLNREIKIGVGLRHSHYSDFLAGPEGIDFVEVHAENFFPVGGVTSEFLQEAAQICPISIHATTLGLGSAQGVPAPHVERLKALVDLIGPLLISDHACFAWSSLDGREVHAGDLLPIPFNRQSLQVIVEHIRHVQERLGRQMLVENLSAYIEPQGSQMNEADFLVRMCEQSGCLLLLDLNNLMVNAVNAGVPDVLGNICDYINRIPPGLVGEIHLAGCTPVADDELLIDDHSRPVSELVWEAYELALKRFGAVPTLIEWDTDLPSWAELRAEADKARAIAVDLLSRDREAPALTQGAEQ